MRRRRGPGPRGGETRCNHLVDAEGLPGGGRAGHGARSAKRFVARRSYRAPVAADRACRVTTTPSGTAINTFAAVQTRDDRQQGRPMGERERNQAERVQCCRCEAGAVERPEATGSLEDRESVLLHDEGGDDGQRDADRATLALLYEREQRRRRERTQDDRLEDDPESEGTRQEGAPARVPGHLVGQRERQPGGAERRDRGRDEHDEGERAPTLDAERPRDQDPARDEDELTRERRRE